MMNKYYCLLLFSTIFPANLATANPRSISTDVQQLISKDRLLAQQNLQNNETVPTGDGKTIAEIEVRFIDKQGNPTEGKTKPNIISI